MNCSYCHRELPDGARVCPYCRMKVRLPEEKPTALQKNVPVAAFALGLAGEIIEQFAWLLFVLSATGGFRNVLVYAGMILGLPGLVCGVVGLILSLRRKGRKIPKYIVFSVIGIAAGAFTVLIFMMNIIAPALLPAI